MIDVQCRRAHPLTRFRPLVDSLNSNAFERVASHAKYYDSPPPYRSPNALLMILASRATCERERSK